MNFEVVFHNIDMAGPGIENYRKTLDTFRLVTTDVIDELSISDGQVPETNTADGAAKTIEMLNDKYPGISRFILDRVVESVGRKGYQPIYEIDAPEDETAKSA
jgi:hypothetical protein